IAATQYASPSQARPRVPLAAASSKHLHRLLFLKLKSVSSMPPPGNTCMPGTKPDLRLRRIISTSMPPGASRTMVTVAEGIGTTGFTPRSALLFCSPLTMHPSSIDCSLFNQQLDQARSIQPSAALALHLRIELVDQRGRRQLRAVGTRGLHRDAQVLAHQVNRETKVEFAVDHGLAAVLHLP